MDKEQRKQLREAYDNRKPDMGIVCWQRGEQMWLAKSKDATADYNSTLFQLNLGSWPNKELQKAYTNAPDSFQWSLLKKLDYEKRDEDHSEDLELLLMMCLDEYPEAKMMRVGKW